MAGTRCLHPGARGCDGQYQARLHGRFFADKVFSVRQKCFLRRSIFPPKYMDDFGYLQKLPGKKISHTIKRRTIPGLGIILAWQNNHG